MTGKIIAFEGPDASGKTTLIHKIQQKLPGIYIHNSYYKGMDVPYEHQKTVNIGKEIAKYNINCYIDRLWLSELIYSNVFRNGVTDYTLEKIKTMQKDIDYTVICLSERDEYFKLFETTKNSREEMFNDMKHIYEQYLTYINGINKNGIINTIPVNTLKNVIVYDMFNDDVNKIIERIL